ncbi:MAG: bifunctional DNA primase/polymerase [Deltaproteobacteria bacterium]|jgi:hypothetical protein|nr:bifunctional DNA primase/polymerase [Deltaproteobacteria bacterium]
MSGYLEDLKAAALRQIEAGRSVILMRQNKTPFFSWKRFQTEVPTRVMMEAMFEILPPDEVPMLALVLGPVSGDFWALDLDGPGAVEWAEAKTPFTGWRVRTPHGMHWYYRMPLEEESEGPWDYAPIPKGFSWTGIDVVPGLKEGSVDLRGPGACLVIPPSLGAKGPYVWEVLDSVPPPRWAPWLVGPMTPKSGGNGGSRE